MKIVRQIFEEEIAVIRAEKLSGNAEMPFLNLTYDGKRSFQLPFGGSLSGCEQLVSDRGQRADDHYLAMSQSSFHDLAKMANRSSIFNGSATEFHNYALPFACAPT
jgi:hypothetical protein